MQVTVQKWDNNLALCIPKASLADGKIIIAVEPQLTLDDLLAGITDSHKHGEINTGPAMIKP
jgi:antitoxin component of MazEF toxin-antitoxin module